MLGEGSEGSERSELPGAVLYNALNPPTRRFASCPAHRSNSKRFKACVEGVRRMGGEKRGDNGEVLVLKGGWKDYKVHVSSMNTFPTAAGLASSAAGYAALVKCLSVVFCASESYPGELSTIARQGSGSACRSLQGGEAERSDSKSIASPSYITNNLPLVASLLASPFILSLFAIHFAHRRVRGVEDGKHGQRKRQYGEAGLQREPLAADEGYHTRC